MIIVTGGAGFIGSNLVAGLNGRNIADILVVDQLGCDQKWKNLRSLTFADYLEKDDFLERLLEDKLPAHIEAVFHLGATSSTTEVDASCLIKNNYEYTKLLARWAINKKARFIYASSAATYGDGAQGFSDSEDNLENLRPINIYGYSKHLFDLWAKRKGLLNKIVGLKYFNVFGPNEYHKAEMRSFVLKAFEQITAAGRVRLFKSYKPEFADGEQKRDFLYVKDAVDMTLYFFGGISHSGSKTAGIFNIGSGTARTWNDLVSAVFAAMERKPKIEYIDMPDSIRNQYQYFTRAEMTKLRSAGYLADITPLEKAIEDYVRNYLVRHG